MSKSAMQTLLEQTERELAEAEQSLETFAKAESGLAEDYAELDAATEESESGEDDEDEDEGEDESEGDDEPEEMAKADQGEDGYIDAGPILQEVLGELRSIGARLDSVESGQGVMAKAMQTNIRGLGNFAKAMGSQPMKPSNLRVPTKEKVRVVELDGGQIMAKAIQDIGEGSKDVSSTDLAKFSAVSQQHGLEAALQVVPNFRKFIS